MKMWDDWWSIKELIKNKPVTIFKYENHITEPLYSFFSLAFELFELNYRYTIFPENNYKIFCIDCIHVDVDVVMIKMYVYKVKKNYKFYGIAID